MNRIYLLAGFSLPAVLLLAVAGCGGGSSATTSSSTQTRNDVAIGQPLPGLPSEALSAFIEGQNSFRKTEAAADGLGPVFNGTSCGECHRQGALGGAGDNLNVARVTRIGGFIQGAYSDLVSSGGAVIQARSLKEFDPTYPIAGEVVPPNAQFVSHRITTPLFGLGLILAIPESTLLARENMADSDGVKGMANRIYNPETGKTEIGRFGWKAQHSSIHLFAGDAYLNEMGITSASFLAENLPQGKTIPIGVDAVADPEDSDGDIAKFTSFLTYLAPPSSLRPMTAQMKRGSELFETARCTSCHVPEMSTGPNSIAALSNRPVRLYSDLLLHSMGSSLADGIQQEIAKGDQFRTAPLWGLRYRKFYLHDGRAGSLIEAVLSHAGEAAPARSRFSRLSPAQQADVFAFLNSL